MIFTNWTDDVAVSLADRSGAVLSLLPRLIGGLVVLVLGLVVAGGLEVAVRKIFESLKFDLFLHKLGITPYVERAGLDMRGSYFVGRLVYWFLVVVFLLASADVFGLTEFTAFLSDVILYVPKVLVAGLIMLAAVTLAQLFRRIAVGTILCAELPGSHFVGMLTWWAIVVFGLFVALLQLNVPIVLLNTIVTGFVAMCAIAGGLAFGLGGKDYAAHLLGKLKARS